MSRVDQLVASSLSSRLSIGAIVANAVRLVRVLRVLRLVSAMGVDVLCELHRHHRFCGREFVHCGGH
jgi:hypothetical protein